MSDDEFVDIHEPPESSGIDSDKTPILLHPQKRKDLFEAGQERFNDERFFEAHEEWEKLWRYEQGRDRAFIQGLIQAAGHFVHLRKGNWSGASRLADLVKQKLVVPPANRLFRAIDVMPLISALNYNAVEVEKMLAKASASKASSGVDFPPPPPQGLGRFLVPKLL
ncbi:MAG: DUF309 domain-containing protein [Deltaproteobacteria bacterium]|nr:DUF309 domain-containing protein [Deltaproteobacteria bacterium]